MVTFTLKDLSYEQYVNLLGELLFSYHSYSLCIIDTQEKNDIAEKNYFLGRFESTREVIQSIFSVSYNDQCFYNDLHLYVKKIKSGVNVEELLNEIMGGCSNDKSMH